MIFRRRNRRTNEIFDVPEQVRAAWDAERARLDSKFDFDAGLTDIYARAGLTPPDAAADAQTSTAETGSDTEQAAVQAVCDQVDMIAGLLAIITDSDDVPVLPANYLRMARRFLSELRDGLTMRRLSQFDASKLITNTEHDLREADRVLRHQHGLSLQDAIHDRISELREIGADMTAQMEDLRERVMRLFDEEDTPSPLTPVH